MSEIEKESEAAETSQKPKGQWQQIAMITIGLISLAFILGAIIPRLLIAPKEHEIVETEEIATPKITSEPEMPEVPIEEVKKQISDIIEHQEAVQKSSDDSKTTNLEPETTTETSTQIEILKEQHEKELSELKDTLSAEHTKAIKKANEIVAGVIAYTDLKDSINNGKAYTEQLNNLKKYTNNNSEIEAILNELAVNSGQPLASQEALNKNFADLVKKAIISQETGVIKKIMNKFITIRKIGEVAGDSDEAILARAEVKIKNNELKAALGEISNLSPASKPVFEEWINQVNHSLNVQRNLEKLQLFFTSTEGELQP